MHMITDGSLEVNWWPFAVRVLETIIAVFKLHGGNNKKYIVMRNVLTLF